jgi:single-stranded-DNA-specific exonuclease
VLIQKEWRILDTAVGSAALPERILRGRQLLDAKTRDRFLNPSLDALFDPFALPDMAAACQIIGSAIEAGQHIVVHGDYDVDGLTATALLVRFLRRNGVDCEPLIPDRLVDGYGLSDASVSRAKAMGAALLITVDCGVTSVDAVAELQAAGIDVVITDHHECLPTLPAARAVINPKRADSSYPTTSLSGVGVTFKLIQALCQHLHLDELDPGEYALMALGTVADVVPLLDENRILVREGLHALNRHLHPGLTALLGVCLQTDRTVDATTIGFTLAPRLNAAGRLGAAMPALELLLTDDPVRAHELAEELQEQNRQRQALEAAILAEAIDLIEADFDFGTSDLIILARQGWHTGVVGIVCSRLVDLYHRPVIVLGGEGDRLKGSARTCGSFDILEAIRAGAAYTRKFGGHRKAAGVELDLGSFEAFRQAINAYAATQVSPLEFRPEVIVDALVSLNDLTEANASAIASLAPFGESNRQPLLVCRDLILTDWRLVGNGKHVRLAVQGAQNRPIVGIAFNLSGADDLFAAGDRVDLLFALEISEFQGRRNLQLQVRDLRPSLTGDRFEDDLPTRVESWSTQPDLAQLMAQYQVPVDRLVPDQQDYVAAYQYLRATYAGRPVQTDLTLLARRIARSYKRPLNLFKLSQILKVFCETSLLTFHPLGQDRVRIELSPADSETKVRLSDAPTYQILKAQGGYS